MTPGRVRTGAGQRSSINGSVSTPASRSPRSRPSLVSVVIPALNAAPYIGHQLAALSRQTYRGEWETLVIDNGSTDGTAARALEFAHRVPGLRVIRGSGQRGANYARMRGIEAAAGDFIAMCDADDVVGDGWLEGLVSAAAEADIVGGPLGVDLLNQGLAREWRGDEPLSELSVKYGFLPTVSGGNCGIWTDVARAVGFDPAYRDGGADIEFSFRALLAGYRMDYAPDALVHMRFRTDMRGLARQWYGYGSAGPRIYRQFRADGLKRPAGYDEIREELRWLSSALPRAVHDPGTRGRCVRVVAFRLGCLAGSLRWRVWFP